MSTGIARLALIGTATLLPTFASAHHGAHHPSGAVDGFSHGFMHPIGGLDHVLAMVAVGLFAATLGGRALWAVPLAFLAAMAAGGALAVAGVTLPYVEAGISLSVVVLGAAVALGRQWPVAVAVALVGAFAVFHGHAHGTEMPPDATGGGYALGFLAATGLLHAAGIGVAVAGTGLSDRYAPQIVRVGGGAVALAGLALLIPAM